MKNFVAAYLEKVKHLLPEKILQPSAGLDIGMDSCKLITLTGQENSLEALDVLVEPVSNGDFAGSIKKLLDRATAVVKNPSVSVSGKGTLIRYLDMPKMPLDDLKKSIELEADKHFPFPKDQIYMDCFILDTQAKDNKMPVLVAAAKKEIIDQRMRLLTELGLQPDFITINAIAIANVFNVLQKDSKNEKDPGTKANAFAVLDIGSSISSLIILKDNIPRFTRDIFIGGRDFNKRIANILNVNAEEAEKIKFQPGDKLPGILSACESIFMNLVSEIRLSFDYFMTEHNTQVSKLYLTGGSSLMEGITDFFVKNLDMPVEKWNPLSNLKLSAGIDPEFVEKNAPQLSVALGLALYPND